MLSQPQSVAAHLAHSPLFFKFYSHDVVWYGISPWPGQVSCLGSVPFQLLASPQPLSLAGQYGSLETEIFFAPYLTGHQQLKYWCVTNIGGFFFPKAKTASYQTL